eukprot:Em0011g73a
MSKHFTSVLRVELPEKEAEERLGVAKQDNTASLQPHPLSPSLLTYQFDHIYTGTEGISELYKSSVREVVEGTLLGYHGTVILFGVKGSGFSDLMLNPSSGLIQKAALHICRCLRRSKESSSQHATHLVVLCSHVIIVDEDVHDLLAEEGGAARTTSSSELPSVCIENGGVVGATTHQVKSSAKVQSLLKRGTENELKILARYGRVPEQGLHHSVFSLSVEYAQFGTTKAPVSGNLSFVQVGAADPLASAGIYQTTQPGQYAPSVASIFGFASVVNVLTSEDRNDLSRSMQGGKLLCADFEKFALVRLLKEALGGNCKTLLVALVPSSYPTGQRSEVSEVLNLSSRARAIQNNPNKRVFAEKALMTAYMKELHKKYGGIQEAAPEMPSANEQKPSEKKVEMAASALAAAAAEYGSDEEEPDEDDDDGLRHSATDTSSPPVKLGGKKKAIPSTVSLSIGSMRGLGSSAERPTFALSQEDMDGTIDVLVSILQDPDHGVPRALDAALKDLRVKRDVGAVFSGADLVRWMMLNIAGVDGEEEAEKLGQMLMDRGVVFHTEGSSVFANAESLLYGVQTANPTTKTLSKEEIQALLMAGGKAEKPSMANVTLVEVKETEGSKRKADKRHSKRHGRSSDGAGKKETVQVEAFDRGLDGSAVHGQDQDSTDVQERGQDSTSVQERGQDSTGVQERGQDGTRSHRRHHRGTGGHDRVQDGSGDNDRGQNDTRAHHRRNKGTGAHERSQSDTGAPPMGQDGADTQDMDTNETGMHGRGQNGTNTYERLTNTTIQEGVTQIDYSEHGEQFAEDVVDDDNMAGGEDGSSAEEVNAPSVNLIQRLPTIFTLENTVDYPHPLHMAAAIGKAPGVLSNLVMMFGVDTMDEYKRTPLMFAALGNKRASCSTLIECGADVNHRDSSGLTPLHVACYHGNRDALGILLNKGAITGLTDRQGHTAIHWSTVPVHPGCLQLVLRNSSPTLVNQRDKKGLTPLHWAIHYDHLEHVKQLLRHTTLLKQDSTGRTLLTYAIERGAIGSVTLLLQHCPALVTLNDVNESTPFHHASVEESPVYLNVLFEVADKAGITVDINKRDKCQQTPLHCAALCNRHTSIKTLLERGALKDITDGEGKTALDLAKEVGGEYTVKLLKGIPVDMPRTNSAQNSQACVLL